MRKSSVIILSLALLWLPSIASAQSAPGASSISTSDTPVSLAGQSGESRPLSGVILSRQDELVPNVSVIVRTATGEQRQTVSDAHGAFNLSVPRAPLTVRFEGDNIAPQERSLGASDATENLQIKIEFVVSPIHEAVVIVSDGLDPAIERRNDTIYKNALFGRDDQLIETLNAGINVGQHEGGGKSLEIRRFGFNLDHGGVNGGLKILVDGVQQNQATQGHGQGYLGQLKSLTPELVEGVDILNGPFSAQYGDFSGLGVVHIRSRESLPDQLTVRLQGGSFDHRRAFVAYSPQWDKIDSFIAYEKSRLDGPFLNPGRYSRDNLTGNFMYRPSEDQTFGLKLSAGRNNFYSSGQIPLDEVAAGRLDRYGFIDPTNGGRVRSATLGAYYRKEWTDGGILKADAFLTRSLFDLFSNFTFFLNDPVNGDGIQQHDSRLQEGGALQYLRPYTLFGRQAMWHAGGNVQMSQINVGLYQQRERVPFSATTSAHARLTNFGQYVQHSIALMEGRLRLDAGLRYDYFRFAVDDKIHPEFSGTRAAGRLQPKLNLAYTPTARIPATVYFNYGRGINSQDARGVVRGSGVSALPVEGQPTPVQESGDGTGSPIATTDFYQIGMSHNARRFSLSADMFLIDHSNEQVYIPDDGTTEFAGPSRAYGYEIKSSVQLTRRLALTGGVTRVLNAFYRGTHPRVYVDSSPHTVANGGLTLADFHGFNGSLRWRHVGNYRLDGEDASIRASGLDVLDLSVSKRLRRWVDFNFSIDNLLNKRYYETQNYFESRLLTDAPVGINSAGAFVYPSRIHGTPGYSVTITTGVTFHFFGKE
jgi:outer membrane receptor protein involved in Fe transport